MIDLGTQGRLDMTIIYIVTQWVFQTSIQSFEENVDVQHRFDVDRNVDVFFLIGLRKSVEKSTSNFRFRFNQGISVKKMTVPVWMCLSVCLQLKVER